MEGTSACRIRGRAQQLADSARIEEAVWYLGYRPSAPWQVFKITPEELWYFDSRVARMRKRVDVAKLDLS